MTNNVCIPPEELDGYGTILRYYDDLIDEWVIVGGTKDLETPEVEKNELDTTSSDTGDGYTTSMPSTLTMLNEVEYEMNFRRSQWTKLLQVLESGRVLCWQLVAMQTPEQWYMQYCGYIRKLGATFPQGDLVTSSIAIKPSGRPTTGSLVSG